ncbi:MAG: hypothetical protein JNK04_23570, partial [Myxococcales bacterium]|nr:hypothetical protein [Myxococcales bacterium]
LAAADSALSKSSFQGTGRATKRGSEIALEIKGTIGGSELSLNGPVAPRNCP